MNVGVEDGRPRVGSFAWLEETGGRLTGPERRAMLPALVRTFGRFTVDRARLALGFDAASSASGAALELG